MPSKRRKQPTHDGRCPLEFTAQHVIDNRCTVAVAEVSADQEIPVVRPGHGSDGRIMGLQDSFKVKSGPILKGKLAQRRSGQQSPSLWRPSNYVNGAAHLVHRGVHKLGGDRIDGIV